MLDRLEKLDRLGPLAVKFQVFHTAIQNPRAKTPCSFQEMDNSEDRFPSGQSLLLYRTKGDWAAASST